MAFRLLPLPTKLRRAQKFADLFNKHTDQRCESKKPNTHIFWHIERCPLVLGQAGG
jgi:hypothetical protein